MIMWPNYIIFFLSIFTTNAAEHAQENVALPPAPAKQYVATHKKSQVHPSSKSIAPQKIAPTVPAGILDSSSDTQVAEAPTADSVIGKVQNFYNSTTSFSAIFRQTVTNQTFNRVKPTISMGRVYILKPGRMRWDYKNKSYKSTKDPKVSKSFISDAKHLWVVMHKNKQFYKSELNGSTLPVAVSFLMGTGDLRKEFNVSFDTSGKYGSKKDIVVILTPKVPSVRYKKLWLVVDSKEFSVKHSIVLNSKGDTNAFRFTSVKTNDTSLKKGHFIYNEKANPDFKRMKSPKQ